MTARYIYTGITSGNVLISKKIYYSGHVYNVLCCGLCGCHNNYEHAMYTIRF